MVKYFLMQCVLLNQLCNIHLKKNGKKGFLEWFTILYRINNPNPYIKKNFSTIQRLRNTSVRQKQKYLNDVIQSSYQTSIQCGLFMQGVLKYNVYTCVMSN